MSNQKFKKPRTPSEALTVLGLPPNENPSVENIKEHYKALARKYHPDKNKDEGALTKFHEISYAYELLTDPSFRHKEEAHETRDLHVVANTAVRFEDAFFGKRIRLTVNFTDPLFSECPVAEDGIQVDSSVALTPVVLSIAPGTLQAEFKFPGKGLTKDGASGDLTIQVRTLPHPMFRIDEKKNSHSQIHVPLRTMLQGGEMDVQTMYGIKKIVIPAGTQPKEQIKLRRLGPAKLYDHFVTVEPEFASKDELKNHEAWKKLDIHWDLQAEADVKDDELEHFRSYFSKLAAEDK